MEDRDGAASFDKLARQQVAPVVGVSDSDYQPRPVQQPIPIMVGAMSELGVIRRRHADIVGLPGSSR